MKTITLFRPVWILIPLFFFTFSISYQQNAIPEEIYSSLKAGNSKVLAKYFNENIEIVLLNKEGVYSRSQAELVIRDFFAKNQPTGFSKLFEGKTEKGDSKYVISQLTTAKTKYRIYFMMKNNNQGFTIHQLRIENDSN